MKRAVWLWVAFFIVAATACGDKSLSNGSLDMADDAQNGTDDLPTGDLPMDDLPTVDLPILIETDLLSTEVDLESTLDLTAAPCVIDAVSYADGAPNPTNPCQLCASSIAADAWTSVADGTTCATGEICATGACAAQCSIDGTIYAADAANPTNACQSCQPAISTAAWTKVTNGATCGDALVCMEGACGTGCVIDTVDYETNATNPANTCQTCAPSVSTSAWTTQTNGASCDTMKVCSDGSCASACFISGATHDDAEINSANTCQVCTPASSNHAWTNRPTGTSCATAKVCNTAATCTSGCYISNALRAASASNPSNFCQTCQPSISTTAWTGRYGTVCGTGRYCNSAATCIYGCLIDGVVYGNNAVNPSSVCQTCDPARSSTKWSNLTELSGCGTNQYCSFGSCVRCKMYEHTGGRQTYVVPGGATTVTVEALGASGGSRFKDGMFVQHGGRGGATRATLVTTPGEMLSINVGGGNGEQAATGADCIRPGGWNGGGQGGGTPNNGCGGGGESDVRRGGTDIGKRVLVAGGGGGAASDTSGNGGAGGGDNGEAGFCWGGFTGGGGGTQTAGGAEGTLHSCGPTIESSDPGSPNEGGEGARTACGGAGGGGGGYYGGAGGPDLTCGGGGGSSWATSGSTNYQTESAKNATQGAHGRICVFY